MDSFSKDAVWLPIDQAPEGEDLLMAVKPVGCSRWKYGVACLNKGIFWDWMWMWPPTHFQKIVDPQY